MMDGTDGWELVCNVLEPGLSESDCPYRMLGVGRGKGRKAVLRAWRRRVNRANGDDALVARLGLAKDRILATCVDSAQY